MTVHLHTRRAYRCYRDSEAYRRSERPELDRDGKPTGRAVFPLEMPK